MTQDQIVQSRTHLGARRLLARLANDQLVGRVDDRGTSLTGEVSYRRGAIDRAAESIAAGPPDITHLPPRQCGLRAPWRSHHASR